MLENLNHYTQKLELLVLTIENQHDVEYISTVIYFHLRIRVLFSNDQFWL